MVPVDRFTLAHANITRTIVKGKASPEIKRMYKGVLEANKIMWDNINIGVDVNHLIELRDIVFEQYKDVGNATNTPGHGIGLEYHEEPFMRGGSQPLEKGHVFTIEPFLRNSKFGGVRVGNMWLMEDEPVLVSKYSKKELLDRLEILEV